MHVRHVWSRMTKGFACLMLSAVLVPAPIVFTGCTTTQGNQSAKTLSRDKEIAGRIKTAIYTDNDVKGNQIQVNSLNGVIQLTGFVASQVEKDRAGQIAASTPGVVRVFNNLLLPTGSQSGYPSTNYNPIPNPPR